MKLNKDKKLCYEIEEVLENVIRNLEYDEGISFEEASDKVYEAVLKWCGITKINSNN